MKQQHYRQAVLVRLTDEQKDYVAREANGSGRRYGHYVRDLIEAERRKGYVLCPRCGGLKPVGAKCLCGGGK